MRTKFTTFDPPFFERYLIEHDVYLHKSATTVTTTCGANLTTKRRDIVMRDVMLLLNHNDRNAFLAISACKICTTVAPTANITARNNRRIDAGSRLLVTHVYRSRGQRTRTHAVSHVTKVRCYFVHSRVTIVMLHIRLLLRSASRRVFKAKRKRAQTNDGQSKLQLDA